MFKYNRMTTQVSYKTNEVKRSYFLNLFSTNAQVKYSPANKASEYTWNIRNLQLGTIAEIGLLQMVSNSASINTTYCIRCLNCYADGFDSYNITSAVLYLGNGLKSPETPTYHKLISDNLNYITLIITDNITTNAGIYEGIDPNITFGVVLEVVDYIDDQNTY
jgi:hypothetical protein